MTDHITLPRTAAKNVLEVLTTYSDAGCTDMGQDAIADMKDALAEPVQEITDTERLNWLDTLPCGITIHGDSSFPQSQSATPKTPGASHIRDLIDRNRAQRKNK